MIKVQKYILFSLFITASFFCSAQKNYAKYFGLNESQVIYKPNAKIKLQPSCYLFQKNKPDSLVYLGCYSSNLGDLKLAYENENQIRQISVNQQIFRIFPNGTGTMDTLKIDLATLSSHLSGAKNKDGESINLEDYKKYNYVLINYVTKEYGSKQQKKYFKPMVKYCKGKEDIVVLVMVID